MSKFVSGLGRAASKSAMAIIANYTHPVETAAAPDAASRRASGTFTTIIATNTFTLGTTIYTFVAALGSPAASNVQILLNGSLRGNVKLLATATQGQTDATNIAYGTGTKPNPVAIAFWTSQRFSLGNTTVAAGENLFILEKAEDTVSALAISTTCTGSVTAFTRTSYLRYVLDGNSTSGATSSIRGSMHCVLPMGSIRLGGQTSTETTLPRYDAHQLTIYKQSKVANYEVDMYCSCDESTYARIARSLPMGSWTTGDGGFEKEEIRGSLITAGSGLYMKIASDSTSSTDHASFKVGYHLYPLGV